MATSPKYLEVIEKALRDPAYLDDLIRDLKKGKKIPGLPKYEAKYLLDKLTNASDVNGELLVLFAGELIAWAHTKGSSGTTGQQGNVTYSASIQKPPPPPWPI